MVIRTFVFVAALLSASVCQAQSSTQPFDGHPWNISTGNLSVVYTQASPVGAHPRPDAVENPPTPVQLKALKANGLVAYEDYITWGAVEREPGHWDWSQHDRICAAMKAAGMKYVVYDWVHFPPTWLRDQQKDRRTLMKCLEHGQETNYLSIFDPSTIQWYDHFYKALHDHFGDQIDNVYACILGPYGEGNYPLNVPDWINIGHCHEGYWCGDEYAVRAFHEAMRDKYVDIKALNAAWRTTFASFDDVAFPPQITADFKLSPDAFVTSGDKRHWLDFITWYHQSLIDFAEKSIQTVLKYYPHEKVRTKPGGTAHGINPVAWGTYAPGYAKMAAKYDIVLQPADCIGAIFGDKWLATAYHFYGVTLGTEPAGGLDEKTFARRMFSDAAAGASQLFVASHTGADAGFEGYMKQADQIRQSIHLYTGQPGETQIAVFCPTTFYRLGGDVSTTIQACYPLRDLCDFDVLDELLITDGALTATKYRALIVFQSDIVEQSILDKLAEFANAGGRIFLIGDQTPRNVEGAAWSQLARTKTLTKVDSDHKWLTQLSGALEGITGVDGKVDGLWTCTRGKERFVFNARGTAGTFEYAGNPITVEPYAIWSNTH